MYQSTNRSQCRTASVILLIGLIFFVSWVHLADNYNITEQSNIPEEFVNKLIKRTVDMTTESSKQKQTDKDNQKTILIWSSPKLHPFTVLGRNNIFQKQNCPYQNCYVTNDRNYFDGDLTKFDAIAFNGRNITAKDLPNKSFPHQDYIYFNTEPSDNFPVCDSELDDFFTLTATYRLDSDVLLNYFDIRNTNGDVVGPKAVMDWVPEMSEIEGEVEVGNKTKAVAWFVSNCHARSMRTAYAKKLQHALEPYGYSLDIFGRCGTMECPRSNKSLCDVMLHEEYYFYFSAENTFCLDYVTEKVLTALSNDVIPIVYGGADYHRFLPPHSYIDARAQSPEELAALIAELIDSPRMYRSYFRWKNFYKYNQANRGSQICAVCEAINNDQKKVYQDFRRWWHPDFENRC